MTLSDLFRKKPKTEPPARSMRGRISRIGVDMTWDQGHTCAILMQGDPEIYGTMMVDGHSAKSRIALATKGDDVSFRIVEKEGWNPHLQIFERKGWRVDPNSFVNHTLEDEIAASSVPRGDHGEAANIAPDVRRPDPQEDGPRPGRHGFNMGKHG